MKFRQKNDHELENLSDDELVAYLVEARDAGFDKEVIRGTGFLIFPRYDQQLAFIRKKVRRREDAEDILGEVIADMLKAAFRGQYTGEFFSLFFVIRDRRIADYYKKSERGPEAAFESGDESDLIGQLVSTGDFTDESEVWMVIEDVLSAHSERDTLVIRQRIDGHPARQVAESVNESGNGGNPGMTPANVDQIYARFKHRLRPELFPEGGRD
ncbi:MAG: sigma-70 family RNA polymerase sigma factor [Solirubrobacterales bacterium]